MSPMPVRLVRSILPVCLCLSGCAGLGKPAPAAGAGSLARTPLPASEPTSTTVGPADTGPAGSASAVGDGTAAPGHP